MKIGIIGTGKISKALTKALTHKGYRVMVGGRNIEKARAIAGEMDHFAESGSLKSAAHYGEVLILAVPFKSLEEVFRSSGSLDGKIVVDCTNALKWEDKMPDVVLGGGNSAGEQILKMLPKSRVVKAFNTSFVELIEQGPYFGPNDASMFYCGNDQDAKDQVKRLIEATGFEPIDCGPMSSARMIESMAALIIRLGVSMGMGRDIAFKLLQRS